VLKFLALSFLLHFGFILSINPKQKTPEVGGSPSGEKEQSETQKIRLVELDVIEKKDNGKVECKDFYIGLGFRHDGYGVVTEIFKGYEAERIGIKVGDWLHNVNDCRGDVGTSFVLTGLRDNKAFWKKATRVKVCGRE